MQPKITPTTNDLLKNGGMPDMPFPPFTRIEEAHEPLNGETPKLAVDNTQTNQEQGAIIPVTEPQPLKVAIVGTAPSSRTLAPFNDPSWQIWVCSAGNMNMVPRVDVWFEIHSNLLWPESEHFGRPYVEWLRQQKFPIYMQDQSLVPNAISYPKDEMVAEFGRYFFTSSFAWMMAMAIKRGAKEIGLWGVDMASRDEYILQRSGGHFFIQEAVRRGISIRLPKESDLLQPPALYGFDDSTNFMRKLCVREKELKDRIAGMKQQRDQLTHSVAYLEGALEDLDYIKTIWGGAQSAPSLG